MDAKTSMRNPPQTTTLSHELVPCACARCGAPTEAVLPGLARCAACADEEEHAWRAGRDAERAAERADRLVQAAMLDPATPACATLTPARPEHADTWRDALAAPRNVFIHGPVGCGKTTLARHLLMRAAASGDVAEVSARRLGKEALRFDEGHFRRWALVPVLLLDDLDKLDRAERTLNALWELLDRRATGNRKTIVTTNLPPVALLAYLRDGAPENGALAAATLDRLKPVAAVKMAGKSLR